MSPNQQLVQYIENEAFKGRNVSEILVDVKNAGWTEQQIQKAVTTLNQEHDVMEQIDLDPLHRKKIHKRSLFVVLLVALATVIVVLLAAAIIRSASRPDLLGFADPNFSMLLPADWDTTEEYIPGASELSFISSEKREPGNEQEAATMTMFIDARQDTFGRLLRDGGSRMRIIEDKVEKNDSITYRFIEFTGLDPYGSNQEVRGLYALIDRGQITMSAMISAPVGSWNEHAYEAEKILTSIEPECSRQSLTAELLDDGTIFLCGDRSV